MGSILSYRLTVSYPAFLALPAPAIAGLLPARVPDRPQADTHQRTATPSHPYVFDDPALDALPDAIRTQFDRLAKMLLGAAAGLLADERAENEFNLAANAFRQQIANLYHVSILGEPKPASASPVEAHRQRLNAKLDRIRAESKDHLAQAREQAARDFATYHAKEESR